MGWVKRVERDKMARTNTYTVVYEHDGTMWHASVAQVEGCQSQGRTLAQARERIRKALALFDTAAHRAVLEEDVRLPRTTRAALKKVGETKATIDSLSRELSERQEKLARELSRRDGVSAADVAELLGLSKQRVQQILKGQSSGGSA